MEPLSYLRDPRAIYATSFETVRREADLSRFAADDAAMAVRLIHACGMVDIAHDLALTPGAVAAGRAALSAGKPVLCDTEMVARGVIRRGAGNGINVVCTLSDPRVPALAADLGTTRSAAAVDLWRDAIDGAVVAIGNAPTALFRLLEHLADGWPTPALILGFPVGFVGAAESKAALIERAGAIPYATLPGRRGGSAMAAAAVNALTVGLDGDGL
ncbi:MAG: precorrin-8X methylmutase [Pseudomonadota bacterium]